MHFACRERAKNFSSPVGAVSPTVANDWYSSQKHHRPEVSFFIPLHLRDSVDHGPLEILLHQGPDRPGKAGVGGNRKVQRDNFARFDQIRKLWERFAVYFC
jgi:hypothetical protein